MSRAALATSILLALTICSCEETVVEPITTEPDAGFEEKANSQVGSNRLDLLIVADNSGSMCQEQEALRNSFSTFADLLIDSDIDFHIGITTTHMLEDYPPEPVAVPGHLQSTPQPVPGFDPECIWGSDANGEPVAGDYSRIREGIRFAALCAGEDPNDYDWTDSEIDCALNGLPECDFCDDSTCGTDDLFPSNYPEFPKVFRTEDFRRDDGTVDRDSLVFDFGCASLVGTRGNGIEKGLEAATLAVSPELTGGAVGSSNADTSAPNHGLFRADSRFGLMFVTDEDDCTNVNGDEGTSCGGTICEYWNAQELAGEDTPLIPVTDLQEDLLTNLSATVGRSVTPEEITIVSLHGPTTVLETVPDDFADACSEFDWEPPPFGCVDPKLGKISTGNRYGRFAALFPSTYPPIEGAIVPDTLCSTGLGAALASGAVQLTQ